MFTYFSIDFIWWLKKEVLSCRNLRNKNKYHRIYERNTIHKANSFSGERNVFLEQTRDWHLQRATKLGRNFYSRCGARRSCALGGWHGCCTRSRRHPLLWSAGASERCQAAAPLLADLTENEMLVSSVMILPWSLFNNLRNNIMLRRL